MFGHSVCNKLKYSLSIRLFSSFMSQLSSLHHVLESSTGKLQSGSISFDYFVLFELNLVVFRLTYFCVFSRCLFKWWISPGLAQCRTDLLLLVCIFNGSNVRFYVWLNAHRGADVLCPAGLQSSRRHQNFNAVSLDKTKKVIGAPFKPGFFKLETFDVFNLILKPVLSLQYLYSIPVNIHAFI